MSVVGVGQLAARAQAAFSPAAARDLGDAGAALGMARRDQRQQPGKIRAQAPVRLDHDRFSSPAWVEAAAITGRPAIAFCKAASLARIGGRRRHIELEIAGGDDMRGAPNSLEALGVGRRARQAEIEPPQQVDDRVRQIAPAPERALRQPAIDQDHRHAAPRRLDHHVRPQIGFHEQREIGLPMIEEAAHEARHVERHELMDDAVRQPLLGQPARR